MSRKKNASAKLQSSYLRIVLVALACIALIGAIVLEALGDDASKVWDAFGGVMLLLAGQHIPTPNAPPADLE